MKIEPIGYKEFMKDLLDHAIYHEQTCECPSHMSGRRLTKEEYDATKLIFSTYEGFQFVMGIIEHVLAFNGKAQDQLNKNIDEIRVEGPVYFEIPKLN